ncbi:MAG TPA: hypothetical protein VHW66_19555 [Stellaceae bacterium]|jgi:hypothetical protein|nr:hypothetical protein [Stellaceae bacterium]
MRTASVVGAPRDTHISAMDQPTRRPPEPEIFPPGRPLPHRGGQLWEGRDTGSVHRIYVRQIGPLGATLLALGVGAAAVLGFFFLIGTAIIGLAAIGALTIVGVIAGILHGPPRPR